MMGKTEKRNVKTEKFFLKKASKDDILVKTSNSSSGNFFVTSEMDKTAEENSNTASKTLRKKKDMKSGNIKNGAVNKTFDKKKWRLRKYSKKYKLEQWENKRKKVVFREFYKQVKDEQPSFNVQKIYEKYSEENENENNLNKNVQESRVGNETQTKANHKTKNKRKPQEEFQRIREESKGKREQIANQKVARAEAKKEYKAKKMEKIKKLNKKTKKGQPIMKYRMEMLLEQIQQSIS